MSFEVVIRSLVAAFWGPGAFALDGGSVVAPSPFERSLVGGDGDRAAGKADRGVSVADQAGQPTPVNDHMAVYLAARSAECRVIGYDPSGLMLKVGDRTGRITWENLL